MMQKNAKMLVLFALQTTKNVGGIFICQLSNSRKHFVTIFDFAPVAEEFMSQLMPIFESLRQKEDLPCSYPLHMHAPSYYWVNNIDSSYHFCYNFLFLFFIYLAVTVVDLIFLYLL